MKANEVLRRYEAGERDFRRVNLRGQSFKGKDLSGADFSEADIFGTNFTGANLREVNFSYAKAGLRHYSVIGLLIISLTVAVLSGLASGFTAYLITYFFQPKSLLTYSIPPGLVVIVILAIFFFVLFQESIKTAFIALAITLTAAIIIAPTAAFVSIIAVLGVIGGVMGVASSLAVAETSGGRLTMAASVLVSVTLAVIGSREMTRLIVESPDTHTILGGTELPAIALGLVLPLLSGYIGWLTMGSDEKFERVQRIAINFATLGKGTSFQGADLTDANFTHATLKGADFRKANITHTLWFQAQKLEQAKVGATILAQPEVRELLVTGQGARKFLFRLNFKRANLAGVNLNNANLTESDLSEASLIGACLEQANLTKVQARETDFSRALLTGACLESWNIDSTTRFDGVICDYVYLSSKQRGRLPSSGKFAPGEFPKIVNK